MREKILNLLYQRKKEYVSGEKLSRKLGISRTAIWKHIQALKREGYKIVSQKRLGYSLVSIPDLLLPYEIKRGLKTKILGKRIYHFKEIGSTNDFAIKLARKGIGEGTIVVAETQTKGKGRLGREWSSPFGGLWLSIILKPKILPTQAPRMTVIASLGIAKTIRQLYSLDAFIKWPNDVLIRSPIIPHLKVRDKIYPEQTRGADHRSPFKKVCGILTEMDAEQDTVNHVIIGIGANLNLDVKKFSIEFRKNTTSMEKELGRKIDRVEFTKRILEEIENFYSLFKEQGFAPILKEWKKLSATLGKRVKAVFGNRIIEGKAIDIDSDGALIIKTKPGKKERILAGNVTLMPG